MLALHIIEGRLRGQEFILPEAGEMVLGKAADGDLAVDDSGAPAQAIVMGSGAGIFIKAIDNASITINRKAVEESQLKEGDRIKLGKVRGVIVAVTRYSKAKGAPPKGPPLKPKLEVAPRETEMGGSLKDTSVSDWLSYFCGTGKNGTVYLKSNRGLGKIFIKEGRICNAALIPSPSAEMSAKRMLFRMLRWKDGTATFAPGVPGDYADKITEPTDIVLLEGTQDEVFLSQLESELPAGQTRLKPGEIQKLDLKKLRPAEMMMLGLVRTKGSVQTVIDHHPAGDVEAATILVDLLKRKIVVPS